jgi:hypothetical protein
MAWLLRKSASREIRLFGMAVWMVVGGMDAGWFGCMMRAIVLRVHRDGRDREGIPPFGSRLAADLYQDGGRQVKQVQFAAWLGRW